MTRRPTAYCIIGAGPAGLAVARALKDHGIEFDILEQEASHGGIWDTDQDHSPVRQSTRFISPAILAGFSGFPIPENVGDYPDQSQILAYLRSFAEHFDLASHIHYQTAVAALQPNSDSWNVCTGDGECRTYRGVILATGHHRKAYIPTYPGHFAGTLLHARDYRLPHDFADQRVLIIGCGNSGAEIACELTRTARSVDLSIRRGYYFLPRYIDDTPTAVWVTSPGSDLPWLLGHLEKQQRLLTEYGVPYPNRGLLQSIPVINDEIVDLIQSRAITVQPNLAELRVDGATFTNGQREEYDTIIYATGYDHNAGNISGHILWQDGHPALIGDINHPDLRRYYVAGLFEANGPAFPLLSAQASVIAADIIGNHHDSQVLQPDEQYLLTSVRSGESATKGAASRRQRAITVDHARYLRFLYALSDTSIPVTKGHITGPL